ncbi:MAG: iron donor protein CyaY [Kofleriaceae bacterium]|nr:MAG: iron donor protein CyaY [Kofleriaceae bacterium]MBZ0236299.1 iron donor protein CyaY [Kofleriaceae bacterium]
MDDAAFDAIAHDEMAYLEDRLGELDPDDVELTVSSGVLRIDLRDGTKIVVNSHRAARQIWMAAIATAWHFDPVDGGRWVAAKTNEELRSTLARLLRERVGVQIQL